MSNFLDKIDQALSVKRLFCLLLAFITFFSLASVNVCADNTIDDIEEAPIIVSMGDSYSAGEGIENFYGSNPEGKKLEDMNATEREQALDWLAHRSQESWPGRLSFPGLNKTAKNYKGTNWYFVAASGAETVHLGDLESIIKGEQVTNPQKGEQAKTYSYGMVHQNKDTLYLPPQLSIFDELAPNSVDYVTITIGGNDAKFADIIRAGVMGSSYLKFGKLTDMLAEVWLDFYKDDGIRNSIYNSYKAIEKKAGAQARIIVAGYPKLLDATGDNFPFFSQQEAIEVNRAVSNFNLEIEKIVDQCANEGMNIYFVSVEEAFEGHEAYAKNNYINPVYLGPKSQELEKWTVASSYSMHPNWNGARVYADCVNAKIKQIAEDEAARLEQEALNPSPKDREVVLVLDQSGSMDGEPMRETIVAAKKFVSSAVQLGANVGVVTYEDYATVCSAITDSEEYLNKRISEIRSGGGTNIEAGLQMADLMLENSSAKKRIIVLMSDGEPNRGKVGQSLVDYANTLKEKGYYIYTLGFFSAADDKETAQKLMEDISGSGNHYEVDNAADIKYFFGDIAEQMSGTKYMYIRIACPVDVTVKYNGEKMTSKGSTSSVRTSFGTMTFEENTEEEEKEDKDDNNGIFAGDEKIEIPEGDNRIKVLRLKEGAEYTIQIEGNGTGKMNYTIGFMDENGEYSDMRRFSNIKITRKTSIRTTASVSDETYMYVDSDGDGKRDLVYRAEANSKAKVVDYSIYVYIGLGVLTALALAIVVKIMVRRAKIKRYL